MYPPTNPTQPPYDIEVERLRRQLEIYENNRNSAELQNISLKSKVREVTTVLHGAKNYLEMGQPDKALDLIKFFIGGNGDNGGVNL